VATARATLAAVAVSPAPDLKSVLPGSTGPFCHPLEDIYAAARRAFPGVTLGGGMFSFFTELNRKRPPAHLLDYVTHTTCPIVHAADDRSVMETLEALPYVIDSARAIAGAAEYRVGPSSIGPRDNPHGAASSPNPDNGRVCLAKMDPRQRGLFGAAWILGYVAAFARGGAAVVTLGSPTGPAGLIHRPADHPQPWYDTLSDAAVYPAFHVVAGLARAAGQARLDTQSADRRAVEAIAHRHGARVRVWLANLTAETQRVQVSGIHTAGAVVRLLDGPGFADAARNRIDYPTAARPLTPEGTVTLSAYAVACVEAAG
jgi:D-apionolactonase